MGFLVGTCLVPVLSLAQEPPETSPMQCVEGETHVLEYGDRVLGCEIDPDIDLDFFEFWGSADEVIRITLSSYGLGGPPDFQPNIELRDPSNHQILNEYCGTNCTWTRVLALYETGTNYMIISDHGYISTGPYVLQLERLLPMPYSVGMDYETYRSITVNHPFDYDLVKFAARAGTEIRLFGETRNPWFDPHVTFFSPDRTNIGDTGCNAGGSTGCSFWRDMAFSESGFHYLESRDSNLDRTGTVEFFMYCLFGDCPSGYYIQDVVFDSPTELSWSPTSDVDATYDVARGDLGILKSAGGDYAASISGCVSTGNVLPFATALDDPGPGQTLFYVARAIHDEIGVGSYDTAGPSQMSRVGGRDAGPTGIDSSPNACGQSTIVASFAPDQPNPGTNTVSMAEGTTVGDQVTIDLQVTDTTGIFGASFDVVFDPTMASFVSWAAGELLEQGGVSVIYLVDEPEPGRVSVGTTRQAAATVDAVGTVSLIRLTFQTIQAGNSIVGFENQALLDGQLPPQPIAGISWFGGTLVAN